MLDDAINHESTQIGYGRRHNFHIAMFVAYTGTDLAVCIASIVVTVEFVYFGVLLYLYIAVLKQVIYRCVYII